MCTIAAGEHPVAPGDRMFTAWLLAAKGYPRPAH
jgi:hypothetical protein